MTVMSMALSSAVMPTHPAAPARRAGRYRRPKAAAASKPITVISAALRPHGLLVVDDMTATPEWTTEQHARQDEVRQALLTSPLLTSAELDHGSGVILATRHA
jgi:hypothetical protein